MNIQLNDFFYSQVINLQKTWEANSTLNVVVKLSAAIIKQSIKRLSFM